MTNAVIVSTARTPLAKSWKGAFNMTHGATLGGHAVKHAVQRAGIPQPPGAHCIGWDCTVGWVEGSIAGLGGGSSDGAHTLLLQCVAQAVSHEE